MTNIYLFDWGDTLMIDFPNVAGKMCNWKTVEAVCGAKETLATLSKNARIYVATGAADSTELDIKRAFERVGLSQFISGYFCKANLGVSKGSAEFLESIIAKLGVPKANIAMVGDNFEKDIKPAIAVGIQAFWFTSENTDLIFNNDSAANVTIIKKLTALHL